MTISSPRAKRRGLSIDRLVLAFGVFCLTLGASALILVDFPQRQHEVAMAQTSDP